MLIEKDKNLDLELALRLAADVQPITVDASTINDVRTEKAQYLYFHGYDKLCYNHINPLNMADTSSFIIHKF